VRSESLEENSECTFVDGSILCCNESCSRRIKKKAGCFRSIAGNYENLG
jgi:hypothetical protein